MIEGGENLGRTINVHMKSLQGDDEYSLVHSADMSQDWTADYTVPRRLKVALAGNTSSSNPGVIAIKNITVTGSGRADLEYATA